MHAYAIYFTFLVLAKYACASKDYSNYTLYRVIPMNAIHMEFLSRLKDLYDVNFWREPGVMYGTVDFVINPLDRQAFLNAATKQHLFASVLKEDVQRAFNQQTVRPLMTRGSNAMTWTHYYRLDDIYYWLKNLSKAYPDEVEVQSIGRSYEERNIYAVKVVLVGSKVKSTVIVEGGIHAREWISPAVVTYLIDTIVRARTSWDDILKSVALSYEWYFVPILNPDGYEYTHTDDRLWRKNRNGHGIDLNRNFGYAFGVAGASKDPTLDSYCGQKAFSERESRAMADFIKAKSANLEYYISFHSYGQFMMLPYAFTKKHLENYDEVYDKCQNASKKIAMRFDTKYEIGVPIETVGYYASGLSTCWVKKTFGVPYVITFELRDNGTDGLALPDDKILPTCQETLDGFVSFLQPRENKETYIAPKMQNSGQQYKILDQIVIAFNVLLFIIVRFD